MKKLFPMLLLVSFAMPWAAGASPDRSKRAEDGKYFDAEGDPTYHIAEDGTVDWYTYSGFRRYHSECHVCHGPDGLGSSFAPALVTSLKTMSYGDYLAVVASGRESATVATQQQKMPAFGQNKNVMCFIDDLYVYLKARADGALGRDRPQKRQPKPDAAQAAEKACFSE